MRYANTSRLWKFLFVSWEAISPWKLCLINIRNEILKKSVAHNCSCSGCQMLVRHPEGHWIFGVRSILEHGRFHCNKQLHIQGLAQMDTLSNTILERVIEGLTWSSCRDGGGARKSCTTLPPCGDAAHLTSLIYIGLYLKSSSIIDEVLQTSVSTHLYHLIMRSQGWGAYVRGHFSTKSINPCGSSDTDLHLQTEFKLPLKARTFSTKYCTSSSRLNL